MSGAQSLLCEMLSCGEADLDILDRIGFGWDEILDQMDWPRDGLDFNDVLRGAVSVGIINLKEAVSDRILVLEAEESIHGKLESEEAEELEALRTSGLRTTARSTAGICRRRWTSSRTTWASS